MKQIDAIEGKVLIFGGVYSNLQALQAMKSVADQEKIPTQNIICTGDIIAYCAQPVECVELMKKWNVNTISGNVELQIAAGLDDCACDFTEGGRCDIFSKQWYPYAQSKIKGANLKWIQNLPEYITFNYHDKKVVVLHGSYHDTSEFIFKSTPWNTKLKNFTDCGADIILAGHCGLPFSHSEDNKHWLNSGVIGMPANDGKSQVWYMTMEIIDNQLVYQHHSLAYDHEKAAQLMNENQLVPSYAKTIINGYWDNMEILPTEEQKQRGKPISDTI